MFEFYIAAREQKETGHPGIFSRQKHSTIIYVICLLLICLWFAGMVLVGGYARQLWVLWIVKAEVTVEAETPAFKQSTQHYFFKKQPLPVVESVEEEDHGASSLGAATDPERAGAGGGMPAPARAVSSR